MSVDPTACPTAEPPPRSQAAADAAPPVPVAGRPATDGNGVVYQFAYTPAERSPEDALDYADYDAEGNLVIRGRLSAAEVLRYTPRALPGEGWMWSPRTRPDLGRGRWAATEALRPDPEDDPPAPSVIVRVDPPDA